MDADNTLTRTGEQAVRTPLPGDSGAAPQALAHGTTADGSPDASSGPASQTRPPARTAMADPSGAGVEGPSVRESPGAAASGCPSATDAGTSIRELLDAAHELTRRGNTCHAQAARLTAQAARMAEEQRERSGWGVVAQHALRNAMTGKQAKQAARAGAAGLDLPVVREAQDKGELTVESTDAIMAAARRSDDPEVQQKVVESGVRLAKDQPTGKVKAFAERLVSHLDPAALQKGHAQETEKRNVQLVPKPHGMAKMTAFGPAVELRMVMDGVEAAARKAAEFDKELEVSRTPAQRSFDVFVSMWMPCDQPEERAKSVNQLMARPHMLIHVPAG
ncbi:MAG: hypothetical protein LBK95_03670, partial [Bifidobacteriaceae bacterium]|nr:hypothetical protein [Bifidobacteriaceae bacterium]